MKVSTLRELLKTLPDDAEVLVWDEEEAHDIISGHVSEGDQTPALHLDIFQR